MEEHNEDEERYSITPEGIVNLVAFAEGQETVLDGMNVGDVLVLIALTGIDSLRDLNLSKDAFDMPLSEMPDTAEILRGKVRELIEKAVAQ